MIAGAATGSEAASDPAAMAEIAVTAKAHPTMMVVKRMCVLIE